jgi:hypothetical protein
MILRSRVQGPFTRVNVVAREVQENLVLRPPCRWQKVTVEVTVHGSTRAVEVVLDIGHNPAAITALANRIKMDYSSKPVRVIYAMSRDKDVRSCMQIMLGAVDLRRIYFAEVHIIRFPLLYVDSILQSTSFRAISRSELQRIFQDLTGVQFEPLAHACELFINAFVSHMLSCPVAVRDLVDKVLKLTASEDKDPVVIVCGTAFMMPDVRNQLGILEPRYPYSLSTYGNNRVVFRDTNDIVSV